MATNFPSSADDGTTLPDPTAVSKTNNPSHSSLHANTNGAVKAVEAKLGTGASTPINNTLLRGNGTGTSAWAALTSAQLAACLSDETGSGSAVFATTPTLVTPKIDTINESTPSNGTTIGGVNIKSGALNTNNSVITANITDAAITPAKLLAGTGATWPWASWTPTLANLTLGNGTSVGVSKQIGKTVSFRWTFTLGSTSAVGTNPSFTLPVAAHSGYVPSGDSEYSFLAGSYDASASTVAPLLTFLSSTTICRILAPNAAGTYVAVANVTATVPITWATGDRISVHGTYEAT